MHENQVRYYFISRVGFDRLAEVDSFLSEYTGILSEAVTQWYTGGAQRS